jgi:hypothetical protein
MVDNVESAVEWYTKHLGFTLQTNAMQRRHSRTSLWGRSGSCSAGRKVRPDGRWPMAIALNPVAGIAFT